MSSKIKQLLPKNYRVGEVTFCSKRLGGPEIHELRLTLVGEYGDTEYQLNFSGITSEQCCGVMLFKDCDKLLKLHGVRVYDVSFTRTELSFKTDNGKISTRLESVEGGCGYWGLVKWAVCRENAVLAEGWQE